MPKVSCPARSGKAALFLRLSGPSGYHLYSVKRLPGSAARAIGAPVAWSVRKVFEPPVPAYTVAKLSSGEHFCTCPDHTCRKARCKHFGALVALGLISSRKRRPSETAARSALKWLSVGPVVKGGVA